MNDVFIKNAIAVRGKEAGQKWLDSIPDLIQEYQKKWSITVSEPFTLSYNYVAPAKRADGAQAVLKIGFPSDNEFLSEIEALREFNGQGIIKLLEFDREKGIILLERVLPGRPLSTLENDEEATRIAAGVAKKLWKPASKSNLLTPLERWYKGFERYRARFTTHSAPLPEDIVSRGERLFSQMLETTQEPMLIHGDFHHLNILSSERDGWLAIDPKGVIGDPAYDTAVFLYNPIPMLFKKEPILNIVKKRIDIFSRELGIEKKRIISWGIAQSVLSAIWSVEDNQAGEGSDYTIKFATLLLELNDNH